MGCDLWEKISRYNIEKSRQNQSRARHGGLPAVQLAIAVSP
jgi:hypothetical protein